MSPNKSPAKIAGANKESLSKEWAAGGGFYHQSGVSPERRNNSECTIEGLLKRGWR
ncbi:MAG: hypothetical protein LBD41_03200 [Clostridiales Family XIII bacterium]|jgi:hypothetical protein|nr:hypothetical protein [Clostridiales Family XIII bacterium]